MPGAERQIRIDMQSQWKAVQAAFITMCGGDAETMMRREAEREAMEAPLRREYLARAALIKETA